MDMVRLLNLSGVSDSQPPVRRVARMRVPSRKAYTNIGVKFFPYYDLRTHFSQDLTFMCESGTIGRGRISERILLI